VAYRLLDLVSLAVYAFGALTYSTLALYYWRQYRKGDRRGPGALTAFTLVSAVAFLGNLLLSSAAPWIEGRWFGPAATVLGALALGLLPPLMLHLTLETGRVFPSGRSWRVVLAAFYAFSVAAVLLRLDRAPAVSLIAASALGLVYLSGWERRAMDADGSEARWIRALLAAMLACALASLADLRYVDQLADYLLLAFFCVCLYYRERLIFFDVLLRRGVFLSFGMAGLTAVAAVATWPRMAIPGQDSLWLCVFLFGWLAGPPAYEALSRIIDRQWLGRRYSAVEAERLFIRDVQGAAHEAELRDSASRSLAQIFQTRVEVRFDGLARPDPDTGNRIAAEIRHGQACEGSVHVWPRPTGVPFLSDDRRLLHLLSGTLAMLLENVRFRAERRLQEHREQQLRLLASRAELKALRAQINPHFLFNALSVIGGLMQYRPELAADTIDRLAQVFRYTLRRSGDEWTLLGEEVEFITAYLRIEQARFGDRLRVEIDVDPAAERVAIPAMSIQPLIENAIRHGVSAREEPGTLGLRVALADGLLLIEVFDNGPGFPPGFSVEARGEGHGLRNVAERLRGYYGDGATLRWECGGDRTRVILKLPCSTVAYDAAGGRT